jgi:hypothetical protein
VGPNANWSCGPRNNASTEVASYIRTACNTLARVETPRWTRKDMHIHSQTSPTHSVGGPPPLCLPYVREIKIP